MRIRSRYIEPYIAADLERNVVLVAGPRQVGKTTLAMRFLGDDGRYFNWGNRADRKAILAAAWPVSPP